MIIDNDYRKMMVYHNLWFENKFKIKVKVKKCPKLIENKILKKKLVKIDHGYKSSTVVIKTAWNTQELQTIWILILIKNLYSMHHSDIYFIIFEKFLLLFKRQIIYLSIFK